MKAQLRWVLYNVIILLSIQLPLYAQDVPAVRYAYVHTDSTGVSHISSVNIIAANGDKIGVSNTGNILNTENHNAENYLQQLASLDKYGKKQDLKPVVKLLKEDEFKEATNDKKRGHKFYYHLANIFTRLKMYPLAMKCYFKTLPAADENINLSADTAALKTFYQQSSDPSVVLIDTVNRPSVDDLMTINRKDEQMLITDTIGYINNSREVESKPEQVCNITDPFDDGKKASAYALMIHIQQPLSGRRKIFVKLNKVGHTFITLIKYNTDSTFVSRSFGFYPKKDHFLSATPLFPSSTPVFKNDELHNWDETIGKFITEKRFKKILQVVKDYEQKRYHLSKNNCTDFGLTLAGTAGIKIMDTTGHWPLGHGNNPASAGQSVLEGKVLNTDSKGSLFICNDLDIAP
jgi:hypothetical protein